MKAILVEFSLMTRIVVSDDFDIDNLRDEDYVTLREKAVPKVRHKLDVDAVGDLISSIENDEEMPFGEANGEERYT